MFSFIIIVATSMVMAAATVQFLPGAVWPNRLEVLKLAMIFAVIGGLFSLLHPSKKMRSARVLVGLGHSWLSREAVFAFLFTLFTAATYFADSAALDRALSQALGVAAAVFGLALVLSIGQLYKLDVQHYWKNPVHYFSPFVSSFLLAAYFLIFEAGILQWDFLFFALWIIDVALLLFRILFSFKLLRDRSIMRYPGLRPLLWIALIFRLAASTLVMLHVMFLIIWAIPYLLATSILLDRFCFFAGTVQITPEVEIGSIREERMKAAASA